MRRALSLAVGVSALALAARARAASPFAFSVAAQAGLGTTGFGSPEPSHFELPSSGAQVTTASFAGAALAAGLSVELRAFGVVGLCAGALYGFHRVGSDFDLDGNPVRLEFSESELRVPLMLKGVLPGPLLSPFVELGTEFVLPGLTQAKLGALRSVASSEPGFWYSAALGVEWRTPLDALDLRVPFALRLSLNPHSDSSRITPLPSDALSFDSTPAYRVGIETGASIWF